MTGVPRDSPRRQPSISTRRSDRKRFRRCRQSGVACRLDRSRTGKAEQDQARIDGRGSRGRSPRDGATSSAARVVQSAVRVTCGSRRHTRHHPESARPDTPRHLDFRPGVSGMARRPNPPRSESRDGRQWRLRARAASCTVLRMTWGSPAWNPHATFADVMRGISAVSCPNT
jgi:hypothetical protein